MIKKIRLVIVCLSLLLITMSGVLLYWHYHQKTVEAVDSMTKDTVNAVRDKENEKKKNTYKDPKSLSDRAENANNMEGVDTKSSSESFSSVYSPIVRSGEKVTNTGVGSFEIGLSSGKSPSDVIANISTYKAYGKVSVVNCKVISYFDKKLYDQTLILAEVTGADDYISGHQDYKNEDVYILFGTRDGSEIMNKVDVGTSMNISANPSDMQVREIRTGHGVYGNMLIVLGDYTVNK